MIEARIVQHVAATLQRVERQLGHGVLLLVLQLIVRRVAIVGVRIGASVSRAQRQQIGRSRQLCDVAGAEALLDAQRGGEQSTAADEIVALFEPDALRDDVERPVSRIYPLSE